jgi:hypothetical protein
MFAKEFGSLRWLREDLSIEEFVENALVAAYHLVGSGSSWFSVHLHRPSLSCLTHASSTYLACAVLVF